VNFVNASSVSQAIQINFTVEVVNRSIKLNLDSDFLCVGPVGKRLAILIAPAITLLVITAIQSTKWPLFLPTPENPKFN